MIASNIAISFISSSTLSYFFHILGPQVRAGQVALRRLHRDRRAGRFIYGWDTTSKYTSNQKKTSPTPLINSIQLSYQPGPPPPELPRVERPQGGRAAGRHRRHRVPADLHPPGAAQAQVRSRPRPIGGDGQAQEGSSSSSSSSVGIVCGAAGGAPDGGGGAGRGGWGGVEVQGWPARVVGGAQDLPLSDLGVVNWVMFCCMCYVKNKGEWASRVLSNQNDERKNMRIKSLLKTLLLVGSFFKTIKANLWIAIE